MVLQNYNAYTEEDFLVWKTLFDRQMQILPEFASREFLTALERLSFHAQAPPRFSDTNELLRATTGWELTVVPHIIPNSEFFPLLYDKKFSATTWLRKMEQLDYLEEPDMFHDVFGHAPLLSNETFCDFFHGLAQIAMEYRDRPDIIEKLGRVYWFTVEFGLIFENGKTRIYGAGIMSSHGESKYCLGHKPKRVPYDVKTVLNTDYDNSKIQNLYFVIDSFEQLFDSLKDIRKEINELAYIRA